jgi:hypothetical protein
MMGPTSGSPCFSDIKLRALSVGLSVQTRKVVITVQSLLYLLPETSQGNHIEGILLPICIISALGSVS